MSNTIIVDKASMRGTPSGVMASMGSGRQNTIITMKGTRENFVKDPWTNPVFEGFCGECGEGFVNDPRGWKNPFKELFTFRRKY